MDSDERGFRVALVADEFINPAPGGLDVLGVLDRGDWGVILLPPSWYPAAVAAQLLNHVAEHVDEFVHHGYNVVLVGTPPVGLAEALGKLGATVPHGILPDTLTELQAFLAGRATVGSPPAER